MRDNVFIGAKSVIMPNVTIGPNAIVAAGAVVTKDVPPGEIWGGVPAKRIGYFDDYADKAFAFSEVKKNFAPVGVESLSEERIEQEWDFFRKSREKIREGRDAHIRRAIKETGAYEHEVHTAKRS